MRRFFLDHPIIICTTAFIAVMMAYKALLSWGVHTYGAWIGFAAGGICILIGFLWDRHDRQRDAD